MDRRYWLIMPNGGRQLIDPARFDLRALEEQARLAGGRLVAACSELETAPAPALAGARAFDPPITAVGPLFRSRQLRIHVCRVEYHLEINTRPTIRVLGGYYKKRRLVRVYSHDRETGRRPLEELFDTYLHEMAHHLEYTEPDTFDARHCGRRRGRMHSPLFWRILGHLKRNWRDVQALG